MKAGRSQSKTISIKDAIRRSVEKIKKRYPTLNKRMVEIYVSQLIPTVAVNCTEFDIMKLNSYLDEYVDTNMYSIEDNIEEYVQNISSKLSECPCSRRFN